MKFELDISEDEYKILVNALHLHAYSSMNLTHYAMQKGSKTPTGEDFTKEDVDFLNSCYTKTFELQEKIRNAKPN